MRIAIVARSFWPKRAGMEYVVHDLASMLQASGHEVSVFTPKVRQHFEEIEHRYRIVRFGTTLRGLGRLRLKHNLEHFLLGRAFGAIHGARPFDVINAHCALHSSTDAHVLGRRYGLPVVITCHGEDIQRHRGLGYGHRLDSQKDLQIQRNLKRAAAVVSIGDSVYEELVEVIPGERIARIPNGIDSDHRGAEPPVLVTRLKRAGRRKIILSVGRNVPKKCFGIGVDAFAQVAAVDPNAHYVHIGRDGEALEGLAARMGVGDRFHALGGMDRKEVLGAYQAADVFFAPSAIEAFPLVNLEAMASGLPCVVSDGPGNRDAVRDSENGYVVPVGNAEGMAAALLKLLQNEDRRRSFGLASRRLVEAYAWPIVAKQYAELFAQVAETKPTVLA